MKVAQRTEHKTFTEPSVSTIERDLHSTLCLPNLLATFARESVTATGNPSGMNATRKSYSE